MSDHSEAFVAFDTSKLRNAVAIADGGGGDEPRFLGEIDNTPAATAKLVRKLAGKYQRVTFCYEAGPTVFHPLPDIPVHVIEAERVRRE
jgi:hypothetical protein